jgi:hypothetical protein
MENSINYYKIIVAYEIPYNILDSQDPNLVQAREIMYDSLKNSVDSDKYEKFSVKLTLYQLRDTLNYLVTFEAFFRSTSGLPMEEYVGARDIKDKIKKELEEFFNSVDCDYKQLNIKTLV